MISDLAVAGWLKRMSDDPTQDPQVALAASQTDWKDPAQAATVKALVQHQGPLKYSDPEYAGVRVPRAPRCVRSDAQACRGDVIAGAVRFVATAAPQPSKGGRVTVAHEGGFAAEPTEPAAIGGPAAIGDGGKLGRLVVHHKVRGPGKPSEPPA